MSKIDDDDMCFAPPCLRDSQIESRASDIFVSLRNCSFNSFVTYFGSCSKPGRFSNQFFDFTLKGFIHFKIVFEARCNWTSQPIAINKLKDYGDY